MTEIFTDTRSRVWRIIAIFKKEAKTLLMDKSALVVIFIIPIVLICVLGASPPNTELLATTIWIVDYDHTSQSQQFIDTMKATNISLPAGGKIPYDVYASGESAPIEPDYGENKKWGYVSEELAQITIGSEYLDAYIILQEGFQAALYENGSASISIYIDAIDFTSMLISDMIILVGLTNVQAENMLFERDIFYFPETRPANYKINLLDTAAPYFIPLMLIFSIMLISSQAIVGDVPLKRLLNTTLKRGEVVTGKILGYLVLAVLQILVTMILLQFFHVTMRCLWSELFLLLFLNSLAGVCIGMLVSTISKTRLQASQFFLLILFMLFIIQYYVRNVMLLILNPLEQTRLAYENLAYRGMSLEQTLLPIIYLLITSLLFYLLNLIYIRYLKKEFI